MLPPTSTPADGLSIPLPQANRLLTTFTDFLTVCIHNILFYRGLYPAATFLTSRAYNLPAHQSRHPVVCSWVRDAVDAARAQIAQGAVERLAVVIYDARGAVMERWMFDLAHFPVWQTQSDDDKGKEKAARGHDDGNDDDDNMDDDDDDTATVADDAEVDAVDAAMVRSGSGGVQQPNQSRVNWTDVDEYLRATVRQMAYVGEKMTPLPEGCTFTVAVELRDEAEAPIGHPQPWVPTQPNLQTASRDQRKPGEDVGGASTTVIRAVEAGPLFFECWVEEGKAKLDPPLNTPSHE